MCRRSLLCIACLALACAGSRVLAGPGAGAASAASPDLVHLPAGRFLQGTSRQYGEEVPVHAVTVPAFWLGQHEVTRGEFARFVAASGYRTEAERGASCLGVSAKGRPEQSGATWRDPGFEQADDHPVVCVSWADAQAYLAWLSEQTGLRYRLPSESETEYAIRAGSQAAFPWGDRREDACGAAGGNVLDVRGGQALRGTSQFAAPCDDGYVYTAPVGHYGANAFGLHDMNGNVSEWTQDCYVGVRYDAAPDDGSAWQVPGCTRHVIRGGNWADRPGESAARQSNSPQIAMSAVAVGFRVARSE